MEVKSLLRYIDIFFIHILLSWHSHACLRRCGRVFRTRTTSQIGVEHPASCSDCRLCSTDNDNSSRSTAELRCMQ